MPDLLTVLVYALIPVGVTVAGSMYAALRPPGARLRSAIQHFAAGVIFSVAAVELLPDITRVHDMVEVGWTFTAGVAAMLLLEHLTSRTQRLSDDPRDPPALPRAGTDDQATSIPIGQLVAIGVDLVVDGLLVGIGFATGARVGVLLTIALSLELLSLGLATASRLAGRASPARAVLIPTGLSLLLVAGAAIGTIGLRGVSRHTLAGVLTFGLAALLYLVTEELLVEAHVTPDTTFGTAMFFFGFVLFLLLGMAR